MLAYTEEAEFRFIRIKAHIPFVQHENGLKRYLIERILNEEARTCFCCLKSITDRNTIVDV